MQIQYDPNPLTKVLHKGNVTGSDLSLFLQLYGFLHHAFIASFITICTRTRRVCLELRY